MAEEEHPGAHYNVAFQNNDGKEIKDDCGPDPNQTIQTQGQVVLPNDAENHHETASRLQKVYEKMKERRGILSVALSTIFYAWKYVLLEQATTHVHPFQSVAMAMPVLLLGSLLVLAVKHVPPPKHRTQHLWLAIGGISQASNLCFFALSVVHISAGDSAAFFSVSKILVGPVSWLILREPFRLRSLTLEIPSLAGIVFIIVPPFIISSSNEDMASPANVLIGSCFAIGSAISLAFMFTSFWKQAQLEIHIYQIMLSGAFVSLISSIILCSITGQWTRPTALAWMYTTLSGCADFIAQTLLVTALLLENVTVVNIILALEIVVTYILDFVVFGVSSMWTSYIGATLLVVFLFCTYFIATTNEEDTA